MESETASPSTWVVNRGIDTLVVNAFYTDNGSPFVQEYQEIVNQTKHNGTR